MKKIYLLILLSFFSCSAFAEWQKYSSGSDDGTSLYFNKSTIKKNGNKLKLWLLIDYPIPFNSAKSIKYHREFDCKKDTVETLFITAFTGNMGMGELIISGKSENGVTPIIPDSTDAILKNIICRY